MVPVFDRFVLCVALSGLMNACPGLLDYEAAVKLDPGNELLLSDAQRIRDVIQSSFGDGR